MFSGMFIVIVISNNQYTLWEIKIKFEMRIVEVQNPKYIHNYNN